jgi:hypothetical protein
VDEAKLMRYTTTIVLTLIAAGLAGYVFFVERHAKTSAEVEADRVKLAPGLDRDAVTRITLTRPGGKEIALEREAGQEAWRFVAPAAGRADASAVSELLSSVEFLEYRAKVPDQGARARAEFGLNPPRATVRLKAGAKEIVLHAGGDDATGQGVYAARADEPTVYVVEKRFRELCERDVDALRDRVALAFDPLKVKGLVIGGATLAKGASGWSLTAPLRMRAADGKVQDVLRALGALRATRFVDAAADPAGKIVTVTDDAASHTLTVGGACPGAAGEVLAVRGAPETGAFCLAKSDAARLEVDPEALRDLRLLAIRPEDARAVTIRVDGRELALAREAGAWKVTAPTGGTADDDVVRKWLEDLGSYRALAVQTGDAAAFGLGGKAPITVTVKGEGGQGATVTISAAKDGRRWAQRNDEAVLLQMHQEAGDLVSADPLFFRSRKVLDVPRWEVRTITMTAAGTTEVAERGASEQWQLTKPVAMDADAGVIDKLLSAVTDLRAEKFLPGAGAGAFAAAWALRLDTRPAEGDAQAADAGARKARTFTLEIGGDAPDKGCYARTGGTVLVLGKSVCEDLRVRLASRKLVDLGDHEIASITLARGGKTETLERRGPAWHRTSGPRVATEQIDDLLGALRALTARAVATYGPDPGHGLAPPRLELTVKLDGGKDLKLAVGAEAEAGYYARVSGRDLTYVVPRSAVDALEKLAP